MASGYEKVDTNSLRRNMDECREGVDSCMTNECLDIISDNTVWDSSSKIPFQDSLVQIQNLYKELDRLFGIYCEILSLLEKYQTLKGDIEKQIQTIRSAKANLATIENESIRERKRAQISNMEKNLSNNKTKLTQLESQINELANC